ncbi:MAG: helix-turn-helix transcriptional regulator [Abditibacteriaceae bacterium]
MYLFHALLDELLENEGRSLLVGEGLLIAFLNLLKRELDAGRVQLAYMTNPAYQMDAGSADAFHVSFATRLEHYVQSNLSKPLMLDRVAREMYLSPAQFTRNLRRETGKSFNQLLAEHRLEEAKQLLLHSQWTISIIAELVGFRSVSYFCTFFKEHTGEAPSEFCVRSSKNVVIPRKRSKT